MAAPVLIAENDPAGAALPEPATLLLVDDDAFMLAVLADVLGSEGYRILSAGSGAEGLAQLARHQVQVVLSDQCMPGMDGIAFLERVRGLYPRTVRLMLSGQPEQATIAQAIGSGAIDRYYTKPWIGAELRSNIRTAFRLQRERAGL